METIKDQIIEKQGKIIELLVKHSDKRLLKSIKYECLQMDITDLKSRMSEERVPYEVDFSIYGNGSMDNEKIVEYAYMPSGRIVVIVEGRGTESLWFEKDGTNPVLKTSIIWKESRMSDSKDVLKSQELGNIEPDGAEEILRNKYNEYVKKYPDENWADFDKDMLSVKMAVEAMHDFARQRLRSELISFLNSIDTDSFLNMSSEERLVDEYLSGYAT